MADFKIGNSGTLRVTDDGSTVRFYVLCSDSQTYTGSFKWYGTVNGVSVSGDVSLPRGFGSRLLGQWAVATSQTVKIGHRGTGTSGLGGAAGPFSVGISRPLPNAPGTPTVTRVSDTQHALNWTRNSTYTSVVVQRRTDGGAWQQIASITGNASTYTDKTTAANRKYEYRVAGKAASGQSAWSGVRLIYTTPSVPTGVTAVRNGNNIVVAASGKAPYATSFDVRDGSTVVATSVALPWTHVSPNPAVPHTYTVRAKNGALASGYSAASNTVQLLTPPNAPTALAPNGAVLPADEDFVLSWRHNPVDSSSQSAWQMRLRMVGGEWEESEPVEDDRQAAPGMGAPGGSVVEFEVRTKGSHPDWSPWSATARIDFADRPGVAIIQPEDEWDASALPVQWTYLQAQGRPQSVWEAVLRDSDEEIIETRVGSGAATSVTFNHRLTEGAWRVEVRAATGDVWSDWATAPFTVVFDPPVAPELAGEWLEDQGGVQLTVTPMSAVDVPATASIVVERSVNGEVWEPVVVLNDAAVVTDYESLSYGGTRYRATALTSEGAATASEIVVEARSTALWLSGGPGFSLSARLPLNPDVQHSGGRERDLKRYAGRTRPVAVTGEGVSRVVAVSGNVWDAGDTASPDDLMRLAQAEQDLFLFRDPDGRRIYGQIGGISLPRQLTASDGAGWHGYWGYGFTLTEATA